MKYVDAVQICGNVVLLFACSARYDGQSVRVLSAWYFLFLKRHCRANIKVIFICAFHWYFNYAYAAAGEALGHWEPRLRAGFNGRRGSAHRSDPGCQTRQQRCFDRPSAQRVHGAHARRELERILRGRDCTDDRESAAEVELEGLCVWSAGLVVVVVLLVAHSLVYSALRDCLFDGPISSHLNVWERILKYNAVIMLMLPRSRWPLKWNILGPNYFLVAQFYNVLIQKVVQNRRCPCSQFYCIKITLLVSLLLDENTVAKDCEVHMNLKCTLTAYHIYFLTF